MTSSIIPQKPAAAPSPWHIWRQWVAANMLAELAGLGGSAVIGALIFPRLGNTISSAIILALLMILCGTFLEGVLVGLLQWRVLRDPFPTMPRGSWVRATAVGAAIAWALGMIPSTVMNLTTTPGNAAPAEPGSLVVFSLAAAMGLLLGPVLALPQWVVLRHYVRHAGWWIPANALAWAAGMVVVFMGTSVIPAEGINPTVGMVLLVTLAVAGAIVGAIHGLTLVWFLHSGE